jgi:hypothetical protein
MSPLAGVRSGIRRLGTLQFPTAVTTWNASGGDPGGQVATLRDMTAQQKQTAELIMTIKGLKRSRRAAPQAPSEKPQTPRDAYQAISASYWAERRPAAMDLILDQYWRERESELARRVGAIEDQHTASPE